MAKCLGSSYNSVNRQKIMLPFLPPHSKLHMNNLILNKILENPRKRIESLRGLADTIGDNGFLCTEI